MLLFSTYSQQCVCKGSQKVQKDLYLPRVSVKDSSDTIVLDNLWKQGLSNFLPDPGSLKYLEEGFRKTGLSQGQCKKLALPTL